MNRPSPHRALDQAFRHHQAGRLKDAEVLYRKVLKKEPSNVDAVRLLGVLSYQTGKLELAVDLLRRAIRLQPNFPEAHHALGNIFKERGQLDEAIASFRQAIGCRPQFAEAHYDLGNALRQKSQIDDAIIAFRGAIAARPDYAPAHYNLGNALKLKDRLDDAVTAYRHAIALKLNIFEVFSNLGTLLKEQGDVLGAIAAYRRAMTLNPTSPEAHSNLVYAMLFDPACGTRAIAAELSEWNRRHAVSFAAKSHACSNDSNPERPLRVGYVSPDLREHVVGQNLVPLFRHHDRQQFEITCYSQVTRPDAVTGEFQKCSDRWRDIVPLTDEQVAERIRQDQIDILVDLSMHMSGHRLLVFARKPAPVQVTFAAYPGSTGLTAIDYRLSDPYLDLIGIDESIYSERTIRLPDSFWCYDPLNGRDLPISPLPADANGHITFGCLNNFCKINDSVLNLWAAVMREVKNSRLLLLAYEGSHRQRTSDRLSTLGITPARVEFQSRLPRRAYLELYHRIDLGLDSFPYNGHTTSLDSCWMGVPVVTLMGETIVSRAGFCQLSNLGLPELAARTPEQFVGIASGLAVDLPRLRRLRQELRGRLQSSPLMNAAKFASSIEAAYRQMWRGWCGTE